MANASIQTVLNFYYFDISKPEHAEAYADLKENTLNKLGFPAWRTAMPARPIAKEAWKFADKLQKAVGFVYGGGTLFSCPVELETQHLFGDQWNSAPIGEAFPQGARLFNWATYEYENKKIRSGYWLEQKPEMAAILINNVKCGYCGHMAQLSDGHAFCPECLGSQYLSQTDLHLTRMVPVLHSFGAKRAELTDEELAERLPLYKNAQIHGATARDKARIAKERKNIETEYEKTVADARVKFEGLTWLMDNGVKTDNVIYYSHTGRFCFGWRNKLSADVVQSILEIISEFPHPYTLECADGRTLSGN